jgi:hypothetical protein
MCSVCSPPEFPLCICSLLHGALSDGLPHMLYLLSALDLHIWSLAAFGTYCNLMPDSTESAHLLTVPYQIIYVPDVLHLISISSILNLITC